MKTIAVFAALLAVALAAPQHRQGSPAETVVVKETLHDNIGLDSYKYNYQLSDGQTRDESAQVEVRGNQPEDATLRVRGSFSFVGDDGQTYTITYVADENGFQPQGAHIPVAPSVV